MANPFEIPDTEPGSEEPLCPWRAPVHEEYYVDVDSTGQAYQDFETRMGPFDRLGTRGRLVVVTGESGCGKTSLIHRCADRLDAALNRPRFRPGELIIDLTRMPIVELDLAGERHSAVCTELLRRLRQRNLFEVPELSSPVGVDRVRTAYEELAGLATVHNATLIVLLPPIGDTVGDLSEYSFQASTCARLVFFAESAMVGKINEFLAGERRNGTGTVGLAVNPVRAEDGYQFAKSRFRLHSDRQAGRADPVTTVDKREMDKVMEKLANLRAPISVRTLHKGLHAAWRGYEDGRSPQQAEAIDILTNMIQFAGFELRGGADGGEPR